MREILFRGKNFNGIWVYGYLVKTKKHTIILFDDCYDEELKYNFDGNIVYVTPKSVGQYAGLEDKNGQKIFEGDIIEDDEGNILIVEYEDGNILAKFSRFYKSDFDTCLCCLNECSKVVGNIFDNPELLNKV